MDVSEGSSPLHVPADDNEYVQCLHQRWRKAPLLEKKGKRCFSNGTTSQNG